MITDVLFKRYPDQWLHSSGVPADLITILRQALFVIHEDVAPHLPSRDQFYEDAHKRLARELGISQLAYGQNYEERCIRYLGEVYDLWDNAHGTPDSFFKRRLSLIELLFRGAEIRISANLPGGDLKLTHILLKTLARPKDKSAVLRAFEALTDGICELNQRFKDIQLPFEYHNGLIQRIDDQLTSSQIEAPFWVLISDPKWKNIDNDMKEAIDRRDAGKGDAAFYALKALESTIKIISDDLNFTRGSERGASDYIDNLVNINNGRFIDVWEGEAIKHLFSKLRNAQGHGPGSAAPLVLSEQQSTYAIETSMAWIKSIVRRKK